MIRRAIESHILDLLEDFPAVCLIGPRQVGKTTLAKMIAGQSPRSSLYLDLESPSDLRKLTDPVAYLEQHSDKLVILDEIKNKPETFPVLRGLIDSDRRGGRFLILGSSSPALLRQSSETLAGRVVYQELAPLLAAEVDGGLDTMNSLWLRGGFPPSFLARGDRASSRWRHSFIRTHLERELPSLGFRLPAAVLARFWQMLAHSHGQTWNASKIASSLGVSSPICARYLSVLEDTFMVRRLQPFHMNIKKRLVKSPKAYLRDSGILHSLLNIVTFDDLLGHPCAGPSWEGWIIEHILAYLPMTWRASFYRTSAGAEIDLIVERSGSRPPLALEIKRSTAPVPTRGFWTALEDLRGAEAYVVAPVDEAFQIGKGVTVIPPSQLHGLVTTETGA